MSAFFIYTAAIDIGLDVPVILIIVTVILVLLCIRFVPMIKDFRDELEYIESEIRRTDGRERAHWEKKKKKLWLSLLPFVRY